MVHGRPARVKSRYIFKFDEGTSQNTHSFADLVAQEILNHYLKQNTLLITHCVVFDLEYLLFVFAFVECLRSYYVQNKTDPFQIYVEMDVLKS